MGSRQEGMYRESYRKFEKGRERVLECRPETGQDGVFQ